MDVSQFIAENYDYILAAVIVALGFVTGTVARRMNERVMNALGVGDAVEGTSVERTARNFGTTTTAFVARISGWVIYGVAIVLALRVVNPLLATALWVQVTGYLPNIVIALVVIVVGLIAGDKAELAVSERLRGVKLPEIGVLPVAARYSVVFVAALVALSQLGVATMALVVAFAAYLAAAVLLTVVATRDLLAAGAAGLYLLLTEPYGIGDTIRVEDMEGFVQEVDVFVTRIEDDGTEYVVPNHLVIRSGVVRVID